MFRRIALCAALAALALPSLAAGEDTAAPVRAHPAKDGFVYLGTAPGANFGGQGLPRALYMDFLHGGYVFPSGLDLSVALSGMNLFPGADEYSISMGRFSLGYRPFLADPLPMIQPYGFAGLGFGGHGRYVCEPRPSCDPATDACTDSCSRSHWAGDLFVGAGVDFNSFLFFVGQQQILFYAGVEARYEYVSADYHMGVITIPVGIRMQ